MTNRNDIYGVPHTKCHKCGKQYMCTSPNCPECGERNSRHPRSTGGSEMRGAKIPNKARLEANVNRLADMLILYEQLLVANDPVGMTALAADAEAARMSCVARKAKSAAEEMKTCLQT